MKVNLGGQSSARHGNPCTLLIQEEGGRGGVRPWLARDGVLSISQDEGRCLVCFEVWAVSVFRVFRCDYRRVSLRGVTQWPDAQLSSEVASVQ